MDPGDRAYLAKLVAADTGAAAPDAERRVDEAAVRAKQDIGRARSSAVILAFMAGAAALLGAIAAWAAAVTGGAYRDGREPIPTVWIGQNTRSSAFAILNARVNRRSHSFSADPKEERSTLLQLAAVLVFDAIPLVGHRAWNFRVRVGVALALKPSQTAMRKQQWQRQLIYGVKLLR